MQIPPFYSHTHTILHNGKVFCKSMRKTEISHLYKHSDPSLGTQIKELWPPQTLMELVLKAWKVFILIRSVQARAGGLVSVSAQTFPRLCSSNLPGSGPHFESWVFFAMCFGWLSWNLNRHPSLRDWTLWKMFSLGRALYFLYVSLAPHKHFCICLITSEQTPSERSCIF